MNWNDPSFPPSPPAVSDLRAGSLAQPSDALAWVDAGCVALDTELVSPVEAFGRILGAPIYAIGNHPAHATAALDGFALHAAATLGASDYNPLPLNLQSNFAGAMGNDAAMPIALGQTLPAGADAVLPTEEAGLRGTILDVFRPIAVGANLVRAGDEAIDGAVVLDTGNRLRAQDIALLALIGTEHVAVIQRPRVRLLMTRTPAGDIDTILLSALLRRDGAQFEAAARAHDGDSLCDALALATVDSDLILVCGASGLGDNDFAVDSVARAGVLDMHGVAINPGATTALGRADNVPVIVLPGSPLACLYAYEWIAGRAVRRLAGSRNDWPYPKRRARLTRKIASTLGVQEFCRVRLHGNDAEPLTVTDGRLLASAVRADGFVIVPVHSEGYAENTEVTVLLHGSE